RRYQYSAYAVAPVGDLIRLRVDEQRLADIEPSERDVFAVRLDVLSPEVAGISSLGKRRLRTGDRCVGKSRPNATHWPNSLSERPTGWLRAGRSAVDDRDTRRRSIQLTI